MIRILVWETAGQPSAFVSREGRRTHSRVAEIIPYPPAQQLPNVNSNGPVISYILICRTVQPWHFNFQPSSNNYDYFLVLFHFFQMKTNLLQSLTIFYFLCLTLLYYRWALWRHSNICFNCCRPLTPCNPSLLVTCNDDDTGTWSMQADSSYTHYNSLWKCNLAKQVSQSVNYFSNSF